mgnify:CR=1 FL=1
MKRRIIITETDEGSVNVDICFVDKAGNEHECAYERSDFDAVNRLLHNARHETVRKIKEKHLGGKRNG